jgi:hypothetical protein
MLKEKSLFVLLIVSAVLVCYTTVFAEADNLIINPGFDPAGDEAPYSEDGYPQGWKSDNLLDGVITKWEKSVGFPDGGYSVSIEVPIGKAEADFARWEQYVKLPNGVAVVQLSVWVKTEMLLGGTGARITARSFDIDMKEVMSHVSSLSGIIRTGTNDWTPLVCEWQIPANAAYLRVQLVHGGFGKVWFDEVVLKAVEYK